MGLVLILVLVLTQKPNLDSEAVYCVAMSVCPVAFKLAFFYEVLRDKSPLPLQHRDLYIKRNRHCYSDFARKLMITRSGTDNALEP